MTVTFPSVDQWMTISPAPPAGSVATSGQQVALEWQILATVTVVPGAGGAP
jgi:hypothetical protein